MIFICTCACPTLACESIWWQKKVVKKWLYQTILMVSLHWLSFTNLKCFWHKMVYGLTHTLILRCDNALLTGAKVLLILERTIVLIGVTVANCRKWIIPLHNGVGSDEKLGHLEMVFWFTLLMISLLPKIPSMFSKQHISLTFSLTVLLL